MPGGVAASGVRPAVKPRPAPVRGCEWWQELLITATEGYRATLPDRPRDMVCESLFAGMMTEAYVDSALGLKTHIQAACDMKDAAQRFVLRNHAHRLSHFYGNLDDMMDENVMKGGEKCLKCETCRLSTLLPIDCVRFGSPCQPFAKPRNRNGKTPDTGTVREHHHFATLFEKVFVYLQSRVPRGFVMEEVDGMKDIDPVSQKPYAVLFMEHTASLGFSTRCVEINAAAWGPVPRPRLYFVGLTEEIGGAAAADLIVKRVDEILAFRRAHPIPPLFGSKGVAGILPRGDLATQSRREAKELYMTDDFICDFK